MDFPNRAMIASLLAVLVFTTLGAEDPHKSPPLSATRPVDYPGVHNVVAYCEGLISGGVPEGDEGFDSLVAMGIKTIISVDGAQPDIERAKARGMRYVHLPIGYNGMDKARTLEIARAVKDLPHPVYIHCHHGKHRSAGATGAAAVTLGLLTPTEATARMKVSGTAANYTGLYQCVNVATLASAEDLTNTSNAFPEHFKTSGMVQTMVEVDEVFDHLKAIEKAGWKTPKDHPDLVPAAEAGRLADLLRNLKDDEHTQARPDEFAQWLLKSSKQVEAVEEAIVKNESPETISGKFKAVADSCKQCHSNYRD
jgi:protein tyrosine phosphatase (PTP) superfamily phosphohydrolase (DUF442 family)/cytochrome c556